MSRIFKAIGSVILLVLIIYVAYRNIMLHFIPSVDLIKDESTSTLYNSIIPNTNNKEWINYYYSHDSVSSDNIPEEMKFNIAFKNMHTASSVVKEKDIEGIYNKVFGPNTYKKIDSFSGTCSDYVYNSLNSEYIENKSQVNDCKSSNISILSKIVDAKISNNKEEITVVIAYMNSDSKTIYKDCDSNLASCNNVLKSNYTDFDESNLEEYKNTLHKYKFTFIANNDEYYFKEVKKLK